METLKQRLMAAWDDYINHPEMTVLEIAREHGLVYNQIHTRWSKMGLVERRDVKTYAPGARDAEKRLMTACPGFEVQYCAYCSHPCEEENWHCPSCKKQDTCACLWGERLKAHLEMKGRNTRAVNLYWYNQVSRIGVNKILKREEKDD